jgi:hypothetical protein
MNKYDGFMKTVLNCDQECLPKLLEECCRSRTMGACRDRHNEVKDNQRNCRDYVVACGGCEDSLKPL